MQQTNETNTAPPITGQSYRWVMLGLIWLIYAVFGMISASVAPLVTSIKGDLGCQLYGDGHSARRMATHVHWHGAHSGHINR